MTDAPTAPSRANRIIRTVLRIALPLAVIAFGFLVHNRLIATKPQARRAKPPPIQALVEVKPVVRTTEPVIVYAMGTVRPAREVALRAQVSGQVIAIDPRFTEGGTVSAGSPLLTLEPVDYEIDVARAQSDLIDAKYQVQLEAGQQDVARQEWELLGQNADATPAQEALALRQPQRDRAEASLARAAAQLRQAQTNLARTVVIAPFAAVVMDWSVDLGAQVGPQDRLATLVGTEAFWVEVAVPVDRLGFIPLPDMDGKDGARVTVHAGESRMREGRVVRLLPSLEPQGRMARLLVEVQAPLAGAAPLLLGSYVRVAITGTEMQDVLRIPRTALRDGERVWLADDEDHLALQPVEVVWRGRDHILIASGIEPGDRLIVSDLASPAAGTKLQIRSAEGEAKTRERDPPKSGPIAWMAGNSVAANLLMLVLLVGGLILGLGVKQEVFPEFEIETVRVSIAYPGASPEEVEQAIVLAVEESARGLDDVKEVTSTASEGSAVVLVELLEGADTQKAAQDLRNEVDRISSLPEDAEEPQITVVTRRREVVTLMLYGDQDEGVLRETAEDIRERLQASPEITLVELSGVRPYEISIEVSQDRLREHGLTIGEVARRVSAASVELPGGGIKTQGGEILLRMKDRRDFGPDFEQIPILTEPEGATLYLGDIATVHDAFEDVDQSMVYNGQPAAGIVVYRVGDETPIEVAREVKNYVADLEPLLPPGLALEVWRDDSKVFAERAELLLRNAGLGLILVFLLLGIFLETRLAFWCMMGIPISFLGAFVILPLLGVSINMISMFAFIISLGIVVDDAIVVGENIYEYHQRGMPFRTAAARAASDVAMPVTFSILTNMVAFMPMFFVPGFMGKVFSVIPTVVLTVFLISLIESLFILPAHLAHTGEAPTHGFRGWLHARQQRFSRWFSHVIRDRYGPLLNWTLNHRYLAFAIGIAVLVSTLGFVKSGRMGMTLFPKVESDYAYATAVLPYGTAIERTEAVQRQLIEAGQAVAREHGGDALLLGSWAQVGAAANGGSGGHISEVGMRLADAGIREISTADFVRLWRERTGGMTGLESLVFESDRGGPGGGASLTVELSHENIDTLELASGKLAEALKAFATVKDVDDGFQPGKRQFDFSIRPAGQSLGLSARDVARQVRNAFYGAEVVRQQRGRSEMKVMVRLPEDERRSEYQLEELVVRTPAGTDVALRDVVDVVPGRAYTSIKRRDGRRVVNATANVTPPSQTGRVLEALKADMLPELVASYPGLRYSFEGRSADQRESMNSLMFGFLLAMLGVYALLAVPFRSYVQPLIVMISIPFGLVGAVAGHLIMGYSMSVLSMFGIVALSGVVVNDSLLLIDHANRARREGAEPRDAIWAAGVRRFRPILLTTMTTFGGLAPMIFETSRQARFLIPMAISLGYGILFATVITLGLVPCLYLIIEDLRTGTSRFWTFVYARD